ncbi:MAG: hypothetical protein ACTS5A_03675, partial [Candidatus Hodgkinia cicadicola]
MKKVTVKRFLEVYNHVLLTRDLRFKQLSEVHYCNESVRAMFATNRNVALKMRQVNEFSLEEVLRKLSEVDGKTPWG